MNYSSEKSHKVIIIPGSYHWCMDMIFFFFLGGGPFFFFLSSRRFLLRKRREAGKWTPTVVSMSELYLRSWFTSCACFVMSLIRIWILIRITKYCPMCQQTRSSVVYNLLPLEPNENKTGCLLYQSECVVSLFFTRIATTTSSSLVSGCCEPSHPQRITSWLKTNFNLSPSYSFHKSLYHRSLFLKLKHKLYPQFWMQTQKNNTCIGAYLYSAGTQHWNLHLA